MMSKMKKISIIIILLLLLNIIIVIYIFNRKAIPIIMDYASIQTKKIGVEVLRNTGIEEMNKYIKNKDFYKITKNNNNEIESIDFNIPMLNDMLLIVSKNVRKRLKEIENGKNFPDSLTSDIISDDLKKSIIFEVPITVIFGKSYLSGFGPKIPVKIDYSGNIYLDLKTRVKEYGINSCLIEIYVLVQVNQKTILPFSSKEAKLSSEIPIVIKMIKGEINGYNSNGISYSLPIN